MPRSVSLPHWGMSIAALLALCGPILAAPVADRVTVAGDRPAVAISQASPLGELAVGTTVSVTITLPLRNQAGLTDLLRRLSDPTDPQFDRFLTPEQFAEQFSPTEEDYEAAAAFAASEGLTVTGTHPDRLLLDVSGPASAVEAAFGVHLSRYQTADGRQFHAPDGQPSVPVALAGRVSGVVGMSDAAVRHPYKQRRSAALPRSIGSGPQGGLTPTNIKTAYGLSGTSLTGSGQTLAVFELDGYTASDVQAYASHYSLPAITLQNILLDGATGRAGMDSDEVTLDIELVAALAPSASKVLVYETANTDQGILDGYGRIASDDQAKQISTSWGLDEQENDSAFMQSENTIFQQMAAQGQTIYAAAGDNGAYDSGVKSDGLRVDDPASQPYVCGVGGTTLRTTGTGGSYSAETTWNTGSVQGGASGGGISSVWPIPSWQQSVVTTAAKSSTTMRNVPDVALNADTNTGYSIYVGGQWTVYGGCSCSAPLWAGFTALVNQQRATGGQSTIGQINPVLYGLRSGTHYAQDFHDIADNSTNLYYPAVTGYDDATGLGSFIGSSLLADLSSSAWTAVSVATGADGYTRLLWDKNDGTAAVWKVSSSGSIVTEQQFGPYSGWTAKAIATGSDSQTRVLWTNTSGTAAYYLLDSNNVFISQQQYGPYSGWTAQGLAVETDNTVRALWTNTNGTASVWTLSASNQLTGQQQFGPYSGWTAKSLSVGTDGIERLLWDNTSGAATFWRLSVGSQLLDQHQYGPYSGYTATSIAAAPDGTGRVVWLDTDAHIALWTLDSDNTYTGQQSQYGPYTGFSYTAISVGSDGNARLLWDNLSGQAALWSLTASGSFASSYQFGPY